MMKLVTIWPKLNTWYSLFQMFPISENSLRFAFQDNVNGLAIAR